MYFMQSDIYGPGWSTTELTIPEAADQQALVDDQKAAGSVSESGRKQLPVFAAIIVVIVLAFLVGGVK